MDTKVESREIMPMISWKRTKRQVTMRAQRIKISNDAPRGIGLRNSYAWQLKNEIDGDTVSSNIYIALRI